MRNDMLNADLTEKNRAVATSALRITVGMFMAWAGAFVSLTFILMTVYNIVPEDPSSALIAAWLLPMLAWALPAMYAGGRFLGLSLAPRHIWKPLLVITGADTLLIAALMAYAPTNSWAVGLNFGFLVFAIMVTAMPSLVIALFVSTDNRQRMRLQFRLTLVGIIVMGATWLALSLALCGSMRSSITELASDQPYQLYVPRPGSGNGYRTFAGPPDFWTFQSIVTAGRLHQAHMCLYVGPEGSQRAGYHWSFLSGFRFVKNSGAFIAC